jgi:ABC-type uncharacterized transport system substrate-binding protein
MKKRIVFSNIGWLVVTSLVISVESVKAQSQPRKVAYVSTQPASVSTERARELTEAIRARDSVANPEILVFRYHIPSATESAESRDAKVRANREMFAEVLSIDPAVIYAAGAAAAVEFARITTTIPIVIGCKCNPGQNSRWKLIANVCAPERNITGFTRYDMRISDSRMSEELEKCKSSLTLSPGVPSDNLVSARLEMLRDLVPSAPARIGMFFGETYDEKRWGYESKAKTLGVILIPIDMRKHSIDDIPQIFLTNKLDSGLVLADQFLESNTGKLISITRKIPKPTMFPWDEADNGAWLHYGTKVDLSKEAASYIVPLLKGKPISELPVSFPKEYELVVNHALAKEHGWVFPRKFLFYPQREPKQQ